MTKKIARELILDGNTLIGSPLSSGGTKYTINRDTVQFKTARSLIEDLNLKAKRKPMGMIHYEN